MTWPAHALLAIATLAVLAVGCHDPASDDDTALDPDDDDDATADDDDAYDPCDDHPSEVICDGQTALTCDEAGDIAERDECDTAAGWFCLQGTGCVQCDPGSRWCDGLDVLECAADGQSWIVAETCDEAADEVCDGGVCLDPCEQAEAQQSNQGCLFYAVDLLQCTDEGEFGPCNGQFGVAVANTDQTAAAQVYVESIESGQWTVLEQRQVDPLGLEPVLLEDRQIEGTCRRVGAAYRIRADRPIVAYQFNPIETPEFSSDASLLLPLHALGSAHTVVGWGSRPPDNDAAPFSFIDIVAREAGTEVTIIPSIATAAGSGIDAGSPGVAMSPITLGEGDVAQITNLIPGEGLQGTRIESTAPVAVFVGHQCANVPTGYCCCDHIEEQVPSVDRWSTSYVASRLPSRLAIPEVSVWQFVAGDQDTSLTFEASTSVSGLPGTSTLDLAVGDVVTMEVTGTAAHPGDFVVSGTAPFMIAQLMTGVEYDLTTFGDPCLVAGIPVDQYNVSAVVLVPEGWEDDYLTLSRPAGTLVTIDGIDVDAWPSWNQTAEAGTYFESVRLAIDDGVHVIEADQPVGVIVSGIGWCDSYCYVGGLGLHVLGDRDDVE